MWFPLVKIASKERRDTSEVLCAKCVRLRCDLDYQVKNESPSKKPQDASSHARLTYMSPASQHKHDQNQRMERKIQKRKLRKYEYTS